MARLVGRCIDGPDVKHTQTRPVKGKRLRINVTVPTKVLIRHDPSDRLYEVVDGVHRRRPGTLPKHRRIAIQEAAE